MRQHPASRDAARGRAREPAAIGAALPAAAGLCGPLTWMSSVAPGVSRDARSMPRDPSDAPGVPREDPRTRPRHGTASWRGPAASACFSKMKACFYHGFDQALDPDFTARFLDSEPGAVNTQNSNEVYKA